MTFSPWRKVFKLQNLVLVYIQFLLPGSMYKFLGVRGKGSACGIFLRGNFP